ncbi:MAG: DUF2520 domain-containing protein [Planctomycetes bacterium]|nr:DUF2520 domain-containing protein [Planctomycetota bacterium]
MTPPRLAFVGTGPVAQALTSAWVARGGAVTAVLSRDAGRAASLAATCGALGSTDPADLGGADVVVVCVPDRAIPDVGRALASGISRFGAALMSTSTSAPGCESSVRPPVVLHTSGSLPGVELLALAPHCSLVVGSLHPLQSFPAQSPTRAPDVGDALTQRVAGVHWFHEGGGVSESRAMVTLWRGTFHALAPGGKSLYHAGAAVLSNHTVALFADATRLFEAAGVSPAESRPALAALLAGTAANLAQVGVPDALTGPVARGDVATVRRHVLALEGAAPDLLDAYRAMAGRAVVVALAKGSIDIRVAAAIREILAAPGEPVA